MRVKENLSTQDRGEDLLVRAAITIPKDVRPEVVEHFLSKIRVRFRGVRGISFSGVRITKDRDLGGRDADTQIEETANFYATYRDIAIWGEVAYASVLVRSPKEKDFRPKIGVADSKKLSKIGNTPFPHRAADTDRLLRTGTLTSGLENSEVSVAEIRSARDLIGESEVADYSRKIFVSKGPRTTEI